MAPNLHSRGLLGAMSEYPIQISKVQAPPLRDQTLARDRLLEWLAVKIHDRAVLVIAEAGYGKTTLLADFSRRTRLRALWFRLDRGDRDWVGFIAYLVAAVRIHIPEFGPATDSLLRETASTAPPRDAVLDTFLRELGDLPADPTALILDDFHLVDDSPDIRHIVVELLARAPERLSFVFASRRLPPLKLARLRSLGEVAELGTDDLRFDAMETERLFRETYEMRLEPGLIAELSRRTEGWAASLQLVRTALHDRDPTQVRAFIRSLSGAEGHLYDYLAEEVVGDLPIELQQFLMRTSVLETVDLSLGPVAAAVPAAAASDFIDEGEHLGLFGHRGPQTRHQVRAHPLVREFLQARLLRSIGPVGVADIHRRVARAAEALDWRLATYHYHAAGNEDDARRVLSSSIETILATGAYAAAQELASSLSETIPGSAGLVIASRIAQQRADPTTALVLAEQAWAEDPNSTAVLLNLITARTLAGDVSGALEIGELLERSSASAWAEIGRAYRKVMETSVSGSLPVAVAELENLAITLRERSEQHFLGVDLLNQAYVRTAMADPATAKACAEEAITLLASTSAGIELVSARFARASALAHLGDMDEARREISLAAELAPPGQQIETAIEAGQIETFLGEAARAWRVLNPVRELVTAGTDTGEQALLVRTFLHLREGDAMAAESDLAQLRPGEPRTSMAYEARRQCALSLLRMVRGDKDAGPIASAARALAASQGAVLWERYAAVLEGLADNTRNPSDLLEHVAKEDPSTLSMATEAILNRFGELAVGARDAIAVEAGRRPDRWREAARSRLASSGADDLLAIGALLEQIGEPEDIQRLRGASRARHDPRAAGLGRALARRLAPRVLVEDLGRVSITVGDRVVDGSDVRRKVLALLCLLVSKTRFSSTREEVLESLWPELDPASALNSLNQTVYFLRRVFEPSYQEDTSPGYVRQDGETIWIDGGLVDARSRRCRELIRSIPAEPTPESAEELAREYRGRFALDFAYEDWASSYRDSLHASYLRVIEHAIRADLAGGHFARGTFLAEHAAEVDPDSEEVQVALVRLYRLSGAHAAAAEQYAHYANTLRDLGVDPLPFAEV